MAQAPWRKSSLRTAPTGRSLPGLDGSKHRESDLRRLLDQLEQRPCRAAWRAFALLPVPHGLDWYSDTGRELDLGQFGAGADATRISGITLASVRYAGVLRRSGQHPLAAVGHHFHDTAIGLQSDAHHLGHGTYVIPPNLAIDGQLPG